MGYRLKPETAKAAFDRGLISEDQFARLAEQDLAEDFVNDDALMVQEARAASQTSADANRLAQGRAQEAARVRAEEEAKLPEHRRASPPPEYANKWRLGGVEAAQEIAADGGGTQGESVPFAPTPQQAAAAENTPSRSNPAAPDASQGLRAGFNLQKQGLALAAATGQQQAAEESAYLDQVAEDDRKRIDEQTAWETDQQGRIDQAIQHYQKEVEAFAAKKIDPDRIFANQSTGDKIIAGIALFLGAAGSGDHNRAVQVIDKAIERDIDVQKSQLNLEDKKLDRQSGILRNMMDRFGSERLAKAATRLALIENAKIKTQAIVSKYKGPEAIARGQQLIGALEVSEAEARFKFDQLARVQGVPQNSMGAILTAVPKHLQKDAIAERGKVEEWNNLSSDALATYKSVFKTGASGHFSSAVGGSKESYLAAKAKLAGTLVGKIPGLKSNVDFEEVIAPMLPTPGETQSEANLKFKNFQGFLKAQEPASPVLDGYGLRPRPVNERVGFQPKGD